MQIPTYSEAPSLVDRVLSFLGASALISGCSACFAKLPQERFLVLLIPVGGLLLMAASAFRSRPPRQTQRARNEMANRAVEAMYTQKRLSYPFALYLRHFGIDAHRRSAHMDPLWQEPSQFEPPVTQKVDFETALADALWDYVPVVALDRELKALGAGRTRVDDAEWLEVVRKLIVRADSVVLIPGTTPGLIAEYEIIQSLRALEKTCFVMPPSRLRDRSAAQAHWKASADVLRGALGISLPPYTFRGQLFTYTSTGDVEVIVDLSPRRTSQALARKIRKLRRKLENCAPWPPANFGVKLSRPGPGPAAELPTGSPA